MNLNKIKPKLKGESDKYSWNLYKFLNTKMKEKYLGSQIKIYWNHYSRWDGEHLPFTGDISNLMQLIISPAGNKSTGYILSQILRDGKAEYFAIPRVWQNSTDITEWFFDTYENIGRCIFDPEHSRWMQYTDNRYTYINNTRKCNWCGQWHKKEIIKKVKIERIAVWKWEGLNELQ